MNILRRGVAGGPAAPATRELSLASLRGSLWPRLGLGLIFLVIVALATLAVGPAGIPLDATARIVVAHLTEIGRAHV